MALATSKISGGSVTTNCAKLTDPSLIIYSFTKTAHSGLPCRIQRVEFRKQNAGLCLGTKISFSSDGCWLACGYPYNYVVLKERDVFCLSTGTHNNETKECPRPAGDCSGLSRGQTVDGEVGETYDQILGDERIIPKGSSYSSQGLAEACKFVHNDAKFVNERARNDIVLLSRGITRLNDRARQDVAILGSKFLKLDARAREDTEKIDYTVKKRAECLHHIAMILKDKAGSKLKRVADQHWSDGALEADLRRADDLVKRRAMEDACMALELVKNVHDMMVRKMYKIPGKLSSSGNDVRGQITLEKNGKALEFLHGEVSVDHITALQEVYWSMASALSEADGIDYTDPEELELLVTTLIDLDAMDGKSSVSLLAECSSSPDVSTRQALANALAAAPSMWTLGNAGMGALQRLAEDSNPAVAAAASKAIVELKRQWEIEEGDSWRFTMNYPKPVEEAQDCEETDEEEDSSSTHG